MTFKLISALVLCSVLAACNTSQEEVKPQKPDVAQKPGYEENQKPVNGVDLTVLAAWKTADSTMQTLVPSNEALFKLVIRQNEVSDVPAEQKRQAFMKLNNNGQIYLDSVKSKCLIFDATQTSNTVEANVSSINRLAMGTSGPNCNLAIAQSLQAERTVTSRTNEIEKFTTVGTVDSSTEVKDSAIATAAGFVSSTSAFNVNGSYVRYLRSNYRYATASFDINGSFSVKLATGEIISGTFESQSQFGNQPSYQYLLLGTSSQGNIRLVAKLEKGVEKYFFNGAEVTKAQIPSFLFFANDYLK